MKNLFKNIFGKHDEAKVEDGKCPNCGEALKKYDSTTYMVYPKMEFFTCEKCRKIFKRTEGRLIELHD